MQLSFDVVAPPPEFTPTGTVVLLHGILGQGTNLRTLARRFVEARPSWQAVVVDLRAHGASQGLDGEDTVHSAALDVVETFGVMSCPVRAVLGHSFGGKVAMLCAEQLEQLEHLVILDSAPGARRDARGSEQTLAVLATLASAPDTYGSRYAFVTHLTTAGLDHGIAQWLAMNLERDDERFRFPLSLPRIRALLESYFAVDCWPVLERLAAGAGPAFHLVIGQRSRVFDEAERARARGLAERSGGRSTVDVLDTGHWVHVEDPEGTMRLFLERVP